MIAARSASWARGAGLSLALLAASCGDPGADKPVAKKEMKGGGLTVSTSLTATSDSYLRSGSPNQNQGADTKMIIRASGSNRAVVAFDAAATLAELQGRSLVSATAVFTIADNGNNWGQSGRTVQIHRMTQAWSELGVTWNAASDSNTANGSPDGVLWTMDPLSLAPVVAQPTSSILITNGLAGEISLDVTADIAAFGAGAANHGWMLRKTDEDADGRIELASRESPTPPQLVLVTADQPPQPCGDLDCDPGHLDDCTHLPAPRNPACPLQLAGPADTYLKQGSPNQNQGAESILRLQSSGKNRALIRFDQAEIAALAAGGTVTSANLVLPVSFNAANWGTTGRTIDLYRLSQPWTEAGATANCAVDANVTNSSADCAATAWSMYGSSPPFASTPTATLLVTNNTSGTVSFDVLPDVAAFLQGTANNGWILKKTDEGANGQIDFASRETTTPPVLVLHVNGGGCVGPTDACGVCNGDGTSCLPPSLAISGATEGQVTRGPVTVTWSATDGDLDHITATINGTAATSPTVLTADGNYLVVVTAHDSHGHSTTRTLGFTIDATAPVIAIGGVTTGQCSQTPLTPTVEVMDLTSTTTTSILDASGYGPGTPVTNQGPHHLAVHSVDAAGNAADAAIDFTVDWTPPQVALAGFVDGSLQTGDVTVTVQAEDASTFTSTLVIDGVERLSGVRVSGAGAHTAEASVVDCAGNVAQAAGGFTIVSQAPSLALEAPADGQTLSASPVTVSGTVTDPFLSRLTVAGVQIAPDLQGHFSTSVALGPGLTSIAVVATNAAGLVTSVSRKVFLLTGSSGDPAVGGIGLATFIRINMGHNQTGIVGQPLPNALIVKVTDAEGAPVPAIPVKFAPIGGNPTFIPQEDATIADGTATVDTDTSGFASIGVVLGPGAESDHKIMATFPGNRGLPPIFTEHQVPQPAPGAPTSLVGVIYDEEFKPVPGVTVAIDAAGLSTQSGADGRFRFDSGVPSGRVTVHLRGDTATVPNKVYPPSLPIFMQVVAGIENRQDGPIFLPAIDGTSFLDVSPTQGGTLVSNKLPGLALEVGPGQYTFPDGGKTGRLYVSVIEPSDVPMALPNGLFSMKMISFAPGGGTFNPPVRLTMPNVNNLPPGAQTLMYSYSHRFQDWDLLGSGTVSADGTVVVSDPGVGIKESAWHGSVPPRPCPETRCVGQAAQGCDCRCNTGSGRVPVGHETYVEISCPSCPPVVEIQCTCCTSDADCNDGKACTNDRCIHDPDGKSRCDNTPVANADDGNSCNGDEKCCEPSDGCDDGNPCTVDACDPGHVCRHDAVTSSDPSLCGAAGSGGTGGQGGSGGAGGGGSASTPGSCDECASEEKLSSGGLRPCVAPPGMCENKAPNKCIVCGHFVCQSACGPLVCDGPSPSFCSPPDPNSDHTVAPPASAVPGCATDNIGETDTISFPAVGSAVPCVRGLTCNWQRRVGAIGFSYYSGLCPSRPPGAVPIADGIADFEGTPPRITAMNFCRVVAQLATPQREGIGAAYYKPECIPDHEAQHAQAVNLCYAEAAAREGQFEGESDSEQCGVSPRFTTTTEAFNSQMRMSYTDCLTRIDPKSHAAGSYGAKGIKDQGTCAAPTIATICSEVARRFGKNCSTGGVGGTNCQDPSNR